MFCKLSLAPGLALAAAHPHTELTTTKVVPFFAMAVSTDEAAASRRAARDAKRARAAARR